MERFLRHPLKETPSLSINKIYKPLKQNTMKKIISLMAIAAVLFACSKQESELPEDAGLAAGEIGEEKATLSVLTSYFSPDITYTSATAGGKVTVSGTGTINIVDKGVCYGTSSLPTITGPKVSAGSGTGTFSVSLAGLDSATTYYIRAYATKKNGVTKYGNELSFTTLIPPVYGTMTDIDGNVYTTITLGTQTWMLENLRTTRYRNGDSINYAPDNAEWANLRLTTDKGGWCYYNNDAGNDAAYGKLYNWYAVTDTRNIAPEGWRMPSKADWEVLQDYLGANTYSGTIPVIGRKLKESGLDHWASPNPADNLSGFTALPGGQRSEAGGFMYKNNRCRFWSTSTSGGYAFFRDLSYDSESISFYVATPIIDQYRQLGLSVRLVME
jgi:uncharacterized protein (TIGR02145 family)